MHKPVRGRFEAMAHYQALYGFKPVGRHTSLVKELLGDITATCATCEGTGLHGTYGAMGWRACPVCHGLGEVYTIPLEELEERRAKILEVYPEAGVPDWQPGVPIHCPVQDLKTGLIIDACPSTGAEPLQGELPFEGDS